MSIPIAHAASSPTTGRGYAHWAGPYRTVTDWLRIIVGSLVEANEAHAEYCRLVGQGVAPPDAIRAVFESSQHKTLSDQ